MISVCVGSIRSGSVGALIESIIRQSIKDWELIVIIQGNEQQLIDEVSRRSSLDKRILMLHLQEFGRSRALNAGVKASQGDDETFTLGSSEIRLAMNLARRSKKRGKAFYGCENYPNCDFVCWDKPVLEVCPDCGFTGAEAKSNKTRGHFRKCLKCANEWTVEVSADAEGEPAGAA
ncbi:MAG: glycosyltransferase [Oscillochloris sp.]|nr:glycosyltransferase [Oscillochloris sp.]